MMGMGVLPKKHPLNFGMLGNNGKPYANRAVGRADLLIVVGARIADRAIPKPENLTRRAVIHIDIDTAEIGKNVGPTVPLVGDLLLEYHSDPESIEDFIQVMKNYGIIEIQRTGTIAMEK